MFALRQFQKLKRLPNELLLGGPWQLSSLRASRGSIVQESSPFIFEQPKYAYRSTPFFRAYSSPSKTIEELMEKIDKCVKSGDVVVFMKGVPEAPRCGFSNAVCQIFRMHEVKITSYDVLEDEELRQGVKEFSKWPTFPQVFFQGELIGGCDILLQMHQSGELIEELDKIGIKSALGSEEEPAAKK